MRQRSRRTDASGFVPFEANLRPPRLRKGVVARGELVDTLREHADVPVVAVSAPAGYGKTTLLAQWAVEDERPFAFVTVDETCNEPTTLITYLMLALQRLGERELGEVDAGVFSGMADHSAVDTVLLPRLGRLLAHRRAPFVLVVDGADALSARDAGRVLATVVKHIRTGSQLVVAGRTAPRLQLSRLRSQHRLLALALDDLRFTAAETRAAVAAAGVDLSPTDIAVLLERTEGWAAAVYLAATWLRESPGRRESLSTFGGDGSVVADYLREEVLARLSPEQRSFLLRSSVLARMSGPLCDAVLDVDGSAALLRGLLRSNAFVMTLDGHDEWYRCHGMFREVLQSELSRQDPALVACLHARASRWLEAADDIEGAIYHSLAARENQRTAHLIWSQAGRYLASGSVEELRRWLDSVTSEQVLGQATLALTAAWCALESGRPSDHWIAAAERAVEDVSLPSERRSVDSSIALLHATRAHDGIERMQADAERAVGLQSPGDPWQAYAEYLRAVCVLLRGLPEQARDMLETARSLAEALEMPIHQALCLAQLSVLSLKIGDWEKAGEIADSAVELLADIDAEMPSAGLVHCVTTLVLAHRGAPDEAKHAARRAMRLIAVLDQLPPWLAVETRYILGRAHLLMGDTAAARILLSEAQTHLHGATDAVWLRQCLDDAWKQVEAFPLATGMGPSALTTAELRVLQLLPTHMSLEAIGEHLSVSRNTVKTQAIAAYRKLGVSSRAAAVDRAMQLGMIQS